MPTSQKLLVIIFLLLAHVSEAQQPTSFLHIGAAMNSYKGDLSGFGTYSPAFHIGIQLNNKKRVNGALNLGFGSVTGENISIFTSGISGEPSPNHFFKSSFIYLNYDVHINIIKRENLTLYLSQGIGLFRFNPQDDEGKDLLSQRETRLTGETYRNAALMMPTALGAIFYLPNQYGIGLQAGFKNPLTDYLDNISGFGEEGNDNILSIRFSFYVPLKYSETSD